MNKKTLNKSLAVSIVAVLLIALVLTFYGVCVGRDNKLNIKEPNLIDKTASINGDGIGTKMAFDKSKLTFWTISKLESQCIVTFDEVKEFNCLLLNEIGLNVEKFSLYCLFDNGWKLTYRQNEMGVDRIASFDTVKTKSIKIVINEFKNVVRISDIKAYNLKSRDNKDFRLTDYLTNGSLTGYAEQEEKVFDEQAFNYITDILLIGDIRFTDDGEVIETTPSNAQILFELIDGRPVNVFFTIFPPKDPAGTIKKHRDKLIDNIVKYTVDNNFYGVDFDWEYPRSQKEYDIFSDFLVALKAKLEPLGKKLSLALSPWGLKFSEEAIKAIDQVQMMTYDLFDQNGDNNSYNGSLSCGIEYMMSKGFKKSQLNYGISLYGRPTDSSGFWYGYKDHRFDRDEYIKLQHDIFFNSKTSVRDKTVYSILYGLGGIMTFSLNDDLPISDDLSLVGEIGRTIDKYSIKGA